jgi:hypothetical protein
MHTTHQYHMTAARHRAGVIAPRRNSCKMKKAEWNGGCPTLWLYEQFTDDRSRFLVAGRRGALARLSGFKLPAHTPLYLPSTTAAAATPCCNASIDLVAP